MALKNVDPGNCLDAAGDPRPQSAAVSALAPLKRVQELGLCR